MRYSFANIIVDSQRRELWRCGQRVKARRKVFELLLYLVGQNYRVVSKAELHSTLWPRHVVSDATLASCIKELRRAIGDTDPTRRLIRTVHGCGIRLTSEVFIVESQPPAKAALAQRIAFGEWPLVEAIASALLHTIALSNNRCRDHKLAKTEIGKQRQL